MKVKEMVPKVYYKESRDFSAVGRLFEIIFNYMKTNADTMRVDLHSENISPMLLELLCSTVGFETKHAYTTKDLIYVCESFSQLLRKKGSIESIDEAIRVLLTSQKIKSSYVIEEDPADKYNLFLNLPVQMTDTILLADILDYILPAGMTYSFRAVNIDSPIPKTTYTSTDTISISSKNQKGNKKDPETGKYSGHVTADRYLGNIYNRDLNVTAEDLEQYNAIVGPADGTTDVEVNRDDFYTSVVITSLDDLPDPPSNNTKEENNE